MTIIFMYKGPTCNYLVYTLRCAVLSSPNHRVISISDQKIKMAGVENYSWDEYAKGTKWFEDLPGFPESDVFHRCSFVRPAIIKNFCEKNGIEKYFNADADVLVMDDLDRVMEPFNDCDFTISIDPDIKTGMRIGHQNHCLSSLKTISEYIEFCREDIKSSKSYPCDMIAWSRFKDATTLKWADVHGVLDHHIGSEFHRYHNIDGHKYIEWKDGKPHKSRLSDGGLEPLPLIHCWGGTKAYIPEWFRKYEYERSKTR